MEERETSETRTDVVWEREEKSSARSIEYAVFRDPTAWMACLSVLLCLEGCTRGEGGRGSWRRVVKWDGGKANGLCGRGV